MSVPGKMVTSPLTASCIMRPSTPNMAARPFWSSMFSFDFFSSALWICFPKYGHPKSPANSLRVAAKAVSYTHLTLPTICSV